MAKTFLDSRISVYNGVTDTKGSISTIGAFLNDTRYIDEIKRLRTLTNKDERNADGLHIRHIRTYTESGES